jgi:hypothetical protein
MRDQTTVGCSNRLVTFRRRSLNRCIIASKTRRPSRPDSTKTVSGNPGAIQSKIFRFIESDINFLP